MRRLAITGGGTGGHLYPGIAVAEALLTRFPDAHVRFFAGDRLERQVLPALGWPLEVIPARPLPRRAQPSAAAALAVTLWGAAVAARHLRAFRPQAVLATGGYVAGPVGLAARLLGIPLVVQEQNVIPGLTNRLLARWARAVSAPLGVGEGFPSGRVVVTGVPVRSGALSGDRARAAVAYGLLPERPTVLVLGGSQGAAGLNRLVTEALTHLAALPVQVLHQTGPDHLAWVQGEVARRVPQAVLRHVAVPYIDTIGDAYAAADLVVCRSGASTLAEVTAWGLPAVLIPYPHALAGEQEANARVLAQAGAAEVYRESDLPPTRLAERLGALLQDPERRRAMGEASRRLGRPDAAERVVDLLLQAAGLEVRRSAVLPTAGARLRRHGGAAR